MQEFNCFYRLINKQITSSRNFGISKVCNMDQEARIFKLRGTQNNFLTRSTARGEARRTRRRSRQPYWKSVGLSCLFCVLAATTHLNELSESHSEHKSIEGMRTSCSSNINEVSVQVKYNNKQYRSRYDIHVNLCQQNLRRSRSRAVSRIPTIQIKRLLQKSKKVVIKVQKHVRRVVPQSSKLLPQKP